jgi:Tol biopolymer transport system component
VAYISSLATALPGFGSTITQQLWMVALQTGTPALLLGDARLTTPAWSRDGTMLAFSSDRTGPTEIWVLNVGSRTLAQLTGGSGAKLSPTWSPDGSEVAYVSTASGRAELEIVDVRSRRVRHLPFDLEIRDPDWR